MTSRLQYHRRGMSLEVGVERAPILVLTNPERFAGGSPDGMLACVDAGDHEVWILIAPPEAHPFTIGRLLAAAWLNRHEPVISMPLMPARPPAAYVLPSGEMRHTRGKRFAPWVLREIDRIASVYCSRHLAYVEAVLRALRGMTGTFDLVPDDFLLQDPSGVFRLGPAPPEVPVDISQSERVRWNLEWGQVVSQNYARNRYLLHLSDDQLGSRIEHILANVHIVDEYARVTVDSTDPTNRYWFSLLQEVATELHMRHGPYPNGWRHGLVEFSRMPGSLHMSQLDRRLRLDGSPSEGPILVKYTKRAFAEAALKLGSIRIAPASLYSDASLSPAVRDHELVGEVDFNPYFSGIGHDPNLDRMVLPNPRQLVRQQFSTDYYVYCLAQSVSTRLLLDFEAEVALIIHDPSEFLRRLDAVISARLPGWTALSEEVQYYDPLQVTPEEVELPMWKHFKYAYQGEFRCAWIPPRSHQQLAPIYTDIGSLEDIAELRSPLSSQNIADDEADKSAV
jgi:hypothetical protein